MISPQRKQEIIDALRRGTVPRSSLDAFAVGLERFEAALDDELKKVSAGGSVFKAVRGEYGCGKTFFSRWLGDRARKMGFATSEVQVSETETPLHRLETVYRRLTERLATADTSQGALRNIVDSWFYTLEDDVLAEGAIDANDEAKLLVRTNELLEQRLSKVSEAAPTFSAALRGYRQAQGDGNQAMADGILAWLSGQPNVAASAKRFAGVKGDIDHFGALKGTSPVWRKSASHGITERSGRSRRLRWRMPKAPCLRVRGHGRRIGLVGQPGRRDGTNAKSCGRGEARLFWGFSELRVAKTVSFWKA